MRTFSKNFQTRLWRIVISWEPHGIEHCYIPFLYVIDFKGALNFGEAQRTLGLAWGIKLPRSSQAKTNQLVVP